MDERDLEILKQQIDAHVRINLFDGESFVAKVLFVSEGERDVIYDLLETNRPSKYKEDPPETAYRVMFSYIESVEAVSSPSE